MAGIIKLGRIPRFRELCGQGGECGGGGGLGVTAKFATFATFTPVISTETTRTSDSGDFTRFTRDIDRTQSGSGGTTLLTTTTPLISTPAEGAIKVQLGDSGESLTFIPAPKGSTRREVTLKPYHDMLEHYDGPADVVTLPLTSSLLKNSRVLQEIVEQVKKNSFCACISTFARKKLTTPGGVRVDNIFLGTSRLGNPCLRIPKERFVATFGTKDGTCAGKDRPAVDQRLLLATGRGVPIFKTRVDEAAAGLGDNSDRGWVIECKLVNRRTRRTGIRRVGDLGLGFSNGNVVDLAREDLGVALIFRRRPRSLGQKIWRGIKSVGAEIVEAVEEVAEEVADLACDIARPFIDEFSRLSRQAEQKVIASKIRQYANQPGKLAQAKETLTSDPAFVKAAAKANLTPERLAEIGVKLSPAELTRQLSKAFIHKICPDEPPPEFPPPEEEGKGGGIPLGKIAIGVGAVGAGALLIRAFSK